MGLKFGGVTYPLVVPADTRSLARTCDPFVSVFLEFYQAIIEFYCGKAYVIALGAQTGKTPDRRACAETTTLPPELYLEGRAFKFPLLALYPLSDAGEAMHTMRWSKTSTTYQLDYVLPSLDGDTAERVLTILAAVRRLLILVTRKLGDEKYEDGVEVMALAGVMSVKFGSASYGMLPKNSAPGLPFVGMQLVVEHREDVDPSGDVLLERITTTVNSENETVFQVIAASDTPAPP